MRRMNRVKVTRSRKKSSLMGGVSYTVDRYKPEISEVIAYQKRHKISTGHINDTKSMIQARHHKSELQKALEDKIVK